MCAMRRQLFGAVSQPLFLTACPKTMSQSRNSARKPPSGSRVTRPVNRYCTLVAFQLLRFGESMLLIRSTKAVGSIGINAPLRFRLLVMTCATPAAISLSAGVSGTKSGIAIEIGSELPGSIRNLSANADPWPSMAKVSPDAIKNRRRSNRTLLIGVAIGA
jgi:hypothetical protein